MRCETCKKIIGTKPHMEIFTIDAGIFRNFCLDCIKVGYSNLKNLSDPNQDQIDLMVKFQEFIKKNSKRKRAES